MSAFLGRHKELNSMVFFNYEWLYSKIKALSLQHIMADLTLMVRPKKKYVCFLSHVQKS